MKTRTKYYVALALILACASLASASATLLLEEPYGKLGFFSPTGHAAVYFSGICADSPTHLRRCEAAETGIVISRYEGMGYDWMAVPLVPYLYAVEDPKDIPLFADAKMVAFLRDRYRREHLEEVAPDDSNGETPAGHWTQLVGSAYDRTIYAFTIETTSERDDALIEKMNSSPNRSHFHLLTNNCADLAKSIINFYYPKTLHRSLVADVGITTPKEMAKLIVKFSARNPELAFSRSVIGQVPGSMARSTATHGVVEGFLKSKQYIVPSVIVSPVFAGCVLAVYVGTGGERIDPSKDALVRDPEGNTDQPLSRSDRKQYQRQLKSFLKESGSGTPTTVAKQWGKLQSKSRSTIDDQGAPVLQIEFEGRPVQVGATAGNLMSTNTPPTLIREILEARLHSELRHSPQNGLSRAGVARDWLMLQQAQRGVSEAEVGANTVSSPEMTRTAALGRP